ncbi:MAG: hypothetical protein ABSB73_00400 [Solirubrobacteraceae bacterium]|jgi:hypothetical protein
MSVRWEYLVLSWAMTATPPDEVSAVWRLEASFHIFRPGAMAAETRTYDGTQASLLGFELLNELGGEGWELVSSVVERTAVAPAQGYQTAGVPIATTQVFKRPVE